MAHTLIPTDSLFTDLGKSMANVAAMPKYEYMALGTGTGQTNASDTLKTETAESGMARVAGTDTAILTTVANDTAQLTHAFTNDGGTVNVTEVGSFDNATKDKGSMGLYGTFQTAIPVEKGDKITPTLKCQFKKD